MRIATVVGARPQFVKAAVLSRVLDNDCTEEILIHTGQHYDARMSGRFFSELGLAAPRFNLGVGSGPHGYQTGRMLGALETIFLDLQPDAVLVYGDTNSTLSGALAAAKLQIPLFHVEAGLRSWNRRMPEEVNRVLTDHVSSLLFCPSVAAEQNLLNEGVPSSAIRVVGDIMRDAVSIFSAGIDEAAVDLSNRLGLAPRQYALATIHRAENTTDTVAMEAIFRALATFSSSTCQVIAPMHPRTLKALHSTGLMKELSGCPVTVIEPVGYLEMQALERNAALVITDSGGVQKEAYYNKTPCVTLRTETEWTELVDAGWNVLASPRDERDILDTLVHEYRRGHSRRGPTDLYGDGRAAYRIVSDIIAFFGDQM